MPKFTKLIHAYTIVLLLLQFLAAMALNSNGLRTSWVLIYLGGINCVTLICYAIDKRKARSGSWRIPEIQLHTMELLGGWFGAHIGQQYLRHKSSKLSYRLVFWIIVLLWLAASLFLLGKSGRLL